jgi:hypothetical protein
MQKWLSLVFAVVTVAFVAAVFVWRPPARGGAAHAPAASGSASAGSASRVPADAGAGPVDAGRVGDAGELALAVPAPTVDESAGTPDSPFPTSDAGTTLLSGAVAPPVAGDAPKSVVFGVILLQYKGSQGAPATARSREAALELAQQLATEAKQDFKAALAKGDKGSTENVGRMPRGMLEPAPEYVLFSLPKDGVSEPVDTPRGFWIVHRIE